MERDGRRFDFARVLRARFSAIATVLTVVASLVTPTLLVASPAGAISVTSVQWNVAFARQGTALVLTVNTSTP